MGQMTLRRDRMEIESAIAHAYAFWMTSGMPFLNHSFDCDDVHYEWTTDVIGKDGKLAWSIGELPKVEEVNETVAIYEHSPEWGTVHIAGADEVEIVLRQVMARYAEFEEFLQ